MRYVIGWGFVFSTLLAGLSAFLFLGAIVLRSGHERCLERRAGGASHV